VFNDDRIFDDQFEKKLNAIHDHLSVANGMVNLRTGELRPRTQDDNCSIALEMEYNEDALADGNEHWNKFIQSIFDCEGLETDEIIEWVHQWLGYCLTGYTTQACCCVWFGAGSNGKSLLQDMLINLLKTRYGNIIDTWSSKLINELSSAGEGTNSHTAELAKMEHVRIGIINELGANTALDESFKKTIDSTDGLAVRASYGQPKTIAMTVAFNFLTNVYPQHPPTEPFKRRINVVPMLARFCEESKMSKPNDKLIDYNLKHKVMQDNLHKQCVLSWLVQGSMKWFANGMSLPKQPASCITYKEQFISQMDYMSSFAYSADKKDRVAMQDIQKVISGRVSRKVPKPEIIEKMLELTKTKKMLTKVPINAGGLGEGFTNLRILTMEEEEEEEEYQFKAE
jgi:putative DNA primase/helicase